MVFQESGFGDIGVWDGLIKNSGTIDTNGGWLMSNNETNSLQAAFMANMGYDFPNKMFPGKVFGLTREVITDLSCTV